MDIYSFLKQNGIIFERFIHPAVFTCEEAEKYCPKMPGQPIKNLFLRDKEGKKHYLIVVADSKSVDLKKLGEKFNTKLSFASPERLKKYLGVEPGSVSILGLIYDKNNEVELFIDEDISGETLQCHPLINSATLAIDSENMEKFLKAANHKANIIPVPQKG